MTLQVLTWLFAIPLMGFVTGMRTMTSMAVVCWFAWLNLLPVEGSWASWCAKLPVVIAFTVFAAAECIGEKLGKTPRPTRPVVLIVRLFFGGLVGAILASALNASGLEGGTLGVLGAMVGAFAAYQFRQQLVWRIGCKVWQVTLTEDILTALCAILCLGIVTG
jgi:uncharacterized membrane protein